MQVVDLVCPLYEADSHIDQLLNEIKGQQGVTLGNVVFPITDTGSIDNVVNKIAEAGFIWFPVKKKSFSHSLTREKAIYEYCSNSVLVMMSQDVIFTNKYCLYELVKAVAGKVAYAYGRQICPQKTIEYYTRLNNYTPESKIVTKADIDTLQLRAFGSSDAFAAYNRDVFIKLNGYDHIHMMFNEDMYYAKKILEAGYQKAYVAEAVVEHSHKLTLKQLYARYYESGKWFGEHPEFNNYKTTDTGLKLAVFVFKETLKDCNIPVLIRFVPDMLVRYWGMRSGKKGVC